nr:hypothetical protein [uncultured Desulfobacter sp.]
MIFIEPETVTPETVTVQDSLPGNVIRIKTKPSQNTWACINAKAPDIIRGKKIVVFTELACIKVKAYPTVN